MDKILMDMAQEEADRSDRILIVVHVPPKSSISEHRNTIPYFIAIEDASVEELKAAKNPELASIVRPKRR